MNTEDMLKPLEEMMKMMEDVKSGNTNPDKLKSLMNRFSKQGQKYKRKKFRPKFMYDFNGTSEVYETLEVFETYDKLYDHINRFIKGKYGNSYMIDQMLPSNIKVKSCLIELEIVIVVNKHTVPKEWIEEEKNHNNILGERNE